MSAEEYEGFKGMNRTASKKILKKDKHGRPLPDRPSLDLPMQRFAETVDRDALSLFLSQNEKYTGFLSALHDPAYARLSFAKLCRDFHISLHELQTLYTDGQRQLGLLRMSSALPQIMEDVGEDAKSRQIVCPRCDGYKTLTIILERDDAGKPIKTEERTCPVCKGIGEIRQVGDKHARDLVFETAKLTGQKGPMVAIQNNFGAGSTLDAKMEGMLKMTQTIVMGEQTGERKEDNEST